MKRLRPKDAVFNAGLAAIISIPIIICKAKAEGQATVQEPMTFTKASIEYEEAKEEYLTPYYGYSFMANETKPETLAEAEFSGYSFIPLDAEFQASIYQMCESQAVDFNLIMAIIKTESDFQPYVIGDAGQAIGLMQIHPQWWQTLADENSLDLYDPWGNVQCGILIFKEMMVANDWNVEKALKQYNSGNPDFASNTYVDTVLGHYEWILEQKEGE